MSQTIKILTEKDVEDIAIRTVEKLIAKISDGIMSSMEDRLPDAGPKILNDSDGIDILACSVRLHNTLSRLGMKTIGDIRARSYWWFWNQACFGRATMLEFKTRLAVNGVKLNES